MQFSVNVVAMIWLADGTNSLLSMFVAMIWLADGTNGLVLML